MTQNNTNYSEVNCKKHEKPQENYNQLRTIKSWANYDIITLHEITEFQ